MTIKKRLAASVMACAMAISAATAISANAKSLAEAFYSGAHIDISSTCWWSSNDYYTKTAYAGTNGYNKFHYVRATVGNPTNGDAVWADTRRCYTYIDHEWEATTSPLLCNGGRWNFPTAYGFYGTN
ncbi:MAG: hypothetical protein J5582_09465 [Ruminococcus sp.]|uniref:hypothetical protein n=1 Tax=Ruminococcus sp. TaxID=41978 RepID=UPI0025CC8798|nr:hypothetical protein [Ruminococcus sp.]MBO4866774.1 hypothetical protein [Ruminococcus sp.]